MLQKIEVSFKECVQRNQLFHNNLDYNRNKGVQEVAEGTLGLAGESIESPSSAVCNSNSDILEPSFSFRIDVGRSGIEKKNILKRYEDLQTWMWKECLNSSIVRALAYGKQRCLPLLALCDICLAIYDAKEDICPSCHPIHSKVGAEGSFNSEKDGTDGIDSSSPLRIRLIKAIVASLEVC